MTRFERARAALVEQHGYTTYDVIKKTILLGDSPEFAAITFDGSPGTDIAFAIRIAGRLGDDDDFVELNIPEAQALRDVLNEWLSPEPWTAFCSVSSVALW